MNRLIKISLVFLLLGTFLLTSCNYRQNQTQPDIWEKLDLATNTPIRNMYASPVELYLLSDDEFVRINNQNELLERRVFPDLPTTFYGRPSISQYAFTYLVWQDDVQYSMEVHLTKNPDEIFYFNLKDLEAVNDSFTVDLETSARYNGAFNEDNTQFLLPVMDKGSNKYSVFLFDINLTFNKQSFINTTSTKGVEVSKKIDLPLAAIKGDLMNTSYINGFYYITSKWGTYRIDPNTGDYTQVNQIWTLDAFGHQGKIYLTGFNDFDFYVSNDNGLSFEQVGVSPLKYVEVENNQIISQTQLGLPWHLAEDDMLSNEAIRVNNSFVDDGASYWNIRHFYGRYYLSIQKEVYFLEDLEVE